jgi:hypothetical protein
MHSVDHFNALLKIFRRTPLPKDTLIWREGVFDRVARHEFTWITSDETIKERQTHDDEFYSANVQSDSLQMFLTVKSYDSTFEKWAREHCYGGVLVGGY